MAVKGRFPSCLFFSISLLLVLDGREGRCKPMKRMKRWFLAGVGCGSGLDSESWVGASSVGGLGSGFGKGLVCLVLAFEAFFCAWAWDLACASAKALARSAFRFAVATILCETGHGKETRMVGWVAL